VVPEIWTGWLEALKGEGTITELANIFEVYLGQVCKWKKELAENAVGLRRWYGQKEDDANLIA